MTYDFDLIIIGAGAAGMTASIYASRYKVKNIVIGDVVGGTTTEAHTIDNWPGEPGISGFELMNKMAAHVKSLGADIMPDYVIEVKSHQQGFGVKTKNGKELTSKKLLFTSGTKHRHLGLSRESELLGKGVGYCPTCDGLFYQSKIVAVIGGGNSAISAAFYLSDIAQKVYVIYRASKLKGEPLWLEELAKRQNVVLLAETKVVDLVGQEKLEGLELDKPYNNSKVLPVDGLFVEIGLVPQTDLFKTLGGEVNDLGYAIVKADMSTNVPGVYVAGDSTTASNNFHQIVTACGEGAIAAEAVYKSLSLN